MTGTFRCAAARRRDRAAAGAPSPDPWYVSRMLDVAPKGKKTPARRNPLSDRAPASLGLLAIACVIACGARSGLPGIESEGARADAGAGGAVTTGAGGGGAGGAPTTSAGGGGAGGSAPCVDGVARACGSAVGACKPGQQTCLAGAFGPCVGAVGPQPEVCNGIDDDCDGQIDNGFHIGEACKGNGTDQCLDGVTTCEGCKKTGPDKVEVCNGIDDNCNGIIDADCQVGDCKPTLLVTGSTPSSPACIDFPVKAGSTGTIEYPCAGGPVKADLGGVQFTGSVTNNLVTLDGWSVIPAGQSVDGCTWQMHHHIEGMIPSGTVTYSYSEAVIDNPQGVQCWQPCTETGTVQINWVPAP
jgi:hypothetical protein